MQDHLGKKSNRFGHFSVIGQLIKTHRLCIGVLLLIILCVILLAISICHMRYVPSLIIEANSKIAQMGYSDVVRIDYGRKPIRKYGWVFIGDKQEKLDDEVFIALLPIIKQLDYNLADGTVCMYLDYSKITDKSLQSIGDFEKIDAISLIGTKISDTGIASLHRSENMRSLILSDTMITDETLKQLPSKFPLLNGVSILNTKCTHQAICQLSKDMPNLSIYTNVSGKKSVIKHSN